MQTRNKWNVTCINNFNNLANVFYIFRSIRKNYIASHAVIFWTNR